MENGIAIIPPGSHVVRIAQALRDATERHPEVKPLRKDLYEIYKGDTYMCSTGLLYFDLTGNVPDFDHTLEDPVNTAIDRILGIPSTVRIRKRDLFSFMLRNTAPIVALTHINDYWSVGFYGMSFEAVADELEKLANQAYYV